MKDTFYEKAVELKKESDSWTVTSNSLKKVNCSGVWVLYTIINGKKQCLEVGQVADIANEVCRDIGYIVRDYYYNKQSDGNRQKQFPWSEQLEITEESRDLDKYKVISSKYSYLYFDIYTNPEYSDKVKRTNKEIEIAVDETALYWSGFGKEKTIAVNLAMQKYPELYEKKK